MISLYALFHAGGLAAARRAIAATGARGGRIVAHAGNKGRTVR